MSIGVRPRIRNFRSWKTGGGNGLTITAPSAILFADGDQPVSLYDYEAHNLLPYSENFTNWSELYATVTATTLADENASAALEAIEYVPQVAGRYYEIYARITKDAVASSTRFAAIQWYTSVTAASFLMVDTSDAANYGIPTDRVQPYSVSITDDLTYLHVRIVFQSTATFTGFFIVYPAFGALADLYNGGAFRTFASYPSGAATTGGGTNLVTITRTQFRDASSPNTYVARTGTASTLVDSYGDIQFADSKADDSAYTLAISITGGGTLTVADGYETGGANALTYDVGDGTADTTFTIGSESLADINAALRGMQIDGLAGETATLSGTLTGDTTSREATFSISVTSTGAFTADAGWITADTTIYTADAA